MHRHTNATTQPMPSPPAPNPGVHLTANRKPIEGMPTTADQEVHHRKATKPETRCRMRLLADAALLLLDRLLEPRHRLGEPSPPDNTHVCDMRAPGRARIKPAGTIRSLTSLSLAARMKRPTSTEHRALIDDPAHERVTNLRPNKKKPLSSTRRRHVSDLRRGSPSSSRRCLCAPKSAPGESVLHPSAATEWRKRRMWKPSHGRS